MSDDVVHGFGHVEFGYVEVSSALHDRSAVEQITRGVRAEIERVGGTRRASPVDEPDEPFAVLVATGGTEAALLDAVTARRAAVPWEPVLLLAHPLHNSLPAALEAMAKLQHDGVRGRIVQVGAASEAAASGSGSASALATAVGDVAALHRLRRTRLGVVGEPSPWLVASVPDVELVRNRWGIEVVPVDIARTIEDHPGGDTERSRAVAVRFGGRGAVSDELLAASKLHPVLEDAMVAAGVDAITVRCFDYLGALETSGCIALAGLNDSGVVAGCEGDVASAVAMLVVRHLLDRPSWMANPASIDPGVDRLVLAHCTVAPSMVGGVELHSHFESGLGVGLRGHFAPGPVTLLRFGGAALDRHWIAEGEIESAGYADDLCRTQVIVELTEAGRAGELLDAPLGNHLVFVHGHHGDRLERWWRLGFG